MLLVFTGCKKPEDRTCIKSFGTPTTKMIQFNKLSILDLYDDISLNLIQDSLNYIELNDYKNTINQIGISFDSGKLTVNNNTKCKIFRSRKKHPTINLHFSSLNKLNLYGSGGITSVTTWNQDSINIFSEESVSTLSLNVISNDIHCYFKKGALDGSISGSSQTAYCYQSEFNKVQLNNLLTPSLHIASATTGNINVYCSGFLHVELWDTGNVIYFGTPSTIYISEKHRTGELIKG